MDVALINKWVYSFYGFNLLFSFCIDRMNSELSFRLLNFGSTEIIDIRREREREKERDSEKKNMSLLKMYLYLVRNSVFVTKTFQNEITITIKTLFQLSA